MATISCTGTDEYSNFFDLRVTPRPTLCDLCAMMTPDDLYSKHCICEIPLIFGTSHVYAFGPTTHAEVPFTLCGKM